MGVDLAEVQVVPRSEEERLVGHLGPDPLSADWYAAEAVRRLSADPRSIHVALLDQRNVAGFGNEYAAELLFLRGVLPSTSGAGVAALLDLGVRTIRTNRDRADRTFTGVDRPSQDDLGVRTRQAPLPALCDPHPAREDRGGSHPPARHLLVPVLSELTAIARRE